MTSETGRELLNNFSIAIAATDVRDCFHRFRMPRSLGRYCCLRAVPAHVLSMTGEMLQGQGLDAHKAVWPCWSVLPWVSHGPFSWHRAAMKRTLALLPASAECVVKGLQLMHDRGPPLAFVAGEQGHGGACVFVNNLGAMCDHVALSQKMVSPPCYLPLPADASIRTFKHCWIHFGVFSSCQLPDLLSIETAPSPANVPFAQT